MASTVTKYQIPIPVARLLVPQDIEMDYIHNSCHDVLKDADVEGDLKRLEEHLAKSFPTM